MKKLITICMMFFSASAVLAQTYFPIPFPNGDMESTQEIEVIRDGAIHTFGGGFQVWTRPPEPAVAALLDLENMGLAPAEGVDFSQAFRLATLGTPDQGFKIQLQSGLVDVRPSGAGSYIISYQVKSDSIIAESKLSGKFIFSHVISFWNETGYIGETGLGPVIEWKDQFLLGDGFVTVTDTVDLPAQTTGGLPITDIKVAIQTGNFSFSYIFDDFTIQGPESFYDITFKVSNITLDQDTVIAENTSVIFDGAEYSTDAEGLVTVADLPAGSYDWSVATEGYDAQSGSKAVSKFETIDIFLLETLPLGTKGGISATVYPNPASQTVRISSVSSNLKKVELMTLTGAVLMSKTLDASNLEWNVSAYPKGVYFLKMMNENNEVFTERLIIAD